MKEKKVLIGKEDVGNVYKIDITEEDMEKPFIECDIGGGFGCAMVKQEMWEKVGYFDEQFSPCHYDQEDYVLRVKEAGYKNVLSPKANCVHIVAATTRYNLHFFNRVIDINREKFRRKWGKKLRKNQIDESF